MIERYTRPQMGRIWSAYNRYKTWLDVELAVCEAWGDQGEIPQEAINEIREKAVIDPERIAEIEQVTRHDVIAFLTSLEEKIGPSSRYIHLGCTSSDILDTANALQFQEAGKLILQDIDRLLEVLERLAFQGKGVMCMGRTHGVHAEPVSIGLKFAGFYAEFKRHKTRIRHALRELAVGKISGAVGTYAFLSLEIEKDALAMLGLRPDPHSTQIIQRDRYAVFFTALAIMGGGIERLGIELRHLQRTEVLEAEEGFSKGQKGSSAMPHKKNPISAENLCGLSRILRGNALAAMEDQALWHERDISHSSVERIIMPDSTILADYALSRLATLLENLVLHPDRMAKNMELSHGLYFSQRLLLELVANGLPRQKAYEQVQKIALQSWNEGKSFPELVLQDSGIVSLIGKNRLTELFDPAWYLKYEDEIISRALSGGAEDDD